MILRGTVFSQALASDTGIAVLMPGEPRRAGAYKVAYLLHGLFGNSATWLDYSRLADYARLRDTVYVMPEVGRSFYTDMKYGSACFSYIADELPELCRRFFNISARREETAVIGGSMGGYGALKVALSRPERFGICAAFAPACLFLREGMDEQRRNAGDPAFIKRYGQRLLDDFAAIFGPELEWKPEYEILELARCAAASPLKPRLYLACGQSDPFRKDHARFIAEMQGVALDCSYDEWAGVHDFAFFDEALRRTIERFDL